MNNQRVILGISGASGAALGLSVAAQLAGLGVTLDLVISPAARRTLVAEVGADAVARVRAYAKTVHDVADIGASIASGTVPVAGMIVAPCSMRSLAAIAQGLDDNLLTRAASVQLKERRRLVMLTRESPLTLAHLRNMTAVTEMGGIIAPPVPAFYLGHKNMDTMITQIAARAIDLLSLPTPRQAQAWR